MWEISSFSQVSASFFAFLLGAGLSLFYDIIRSLRKIGFKSFLIVFLGDILFSFLSAVITFMFLLIFTNGATRAFVLFFEAIGFIACRVTISKVFLKFLMLIFLILKKVFTFISLSLLRFSEKTQEFFSKMYLFIKKTLKKRPKKAKRS